EVGACEGSWPGGKRKKQPAVIAEPRLSARTQRKCNRIGIDASAVTSQVALAFLGESVAVDENLWQLRRRKHADELALMRHAIRCSEAMHRRAREIIEPGVPELRVFDELHAAAVEAAG